MSLIITPNAPIDSPSFTGVPTAPTAAAETNTTQIATTAFVNSFIPLSYMTIVYGLLGNNTKAEPVGCDWTSFQNNSALTSQQIQFVMVYLPKQATITGVKFWQGTQGVYTSSNYNGFGVYSLNLGTGLLTLIDITTNDGNIFKNASQTMNTKALAATHLLDAGVYVVAALWCSSATTTAPSLASALTVVTGGNAYDFANSIKLSANLGSQTALPTPTKAFSTLTVTGNKPYLALY